MEAEITPDEEFLGYFHSHCNHWNNNETIRGDVAPSKLDLESFLLEDRILLMVAMNPTTRISSFCTGETFVSGTFDVFNCASKSAKYHVKIRPYYKEGNRHRIGRINLTQKA